ncbi:MAG: hypothetical protein M3Z20_02465, partial [Chloroflexota bacterium]|nr:hypothetical protein [Chloroflexota bacterium]
MSEVIIQSLLDPLNFVDIQRTQSGHTTKSPYVAESHELAWNRPEVFRNSTAIGPWACEARRGMSTPVSAT